jgi:putative endonuclease
MRDPIERYFVYIFRCNDGSYYAGVTNNVEERVREHQEGVDPKCYTYKRRPVQLVFRHGFREVSDAIAAEKQIKGWSRRKKEALIQGEFGLLVEFSKSAYARRIDTVSYRISRHSSVILSSSKDGAAV